MKKHKFVLFDSVVATRDIFEPELMGAWGRGKPGFVDGKPAVVKGTHGAVVEVYDNPPGVAVEFFDDEGETIDVAWVGPGVVRHQTEDEVAESRALTDRLNAQPVKLDD
jgi:hypothetical protein